MAQGANVVEFATALVTLSKGVPAMKALYDREMSKRRKIAAQLIQRRLGRGEAWAVAEDETASLLIGYMRAAEDGAAQENLDLLAQVIANGQHEPTLVSARFRRWRQVFSDMSREEILVLGRFAAGVLAHRRNSNPEQPSEGQAGFINAVADLTGSGRPLERPEDVGMHLSALQRTGLVIVSDAWNGGHIVSAVPGPRPCKFRR